MEKMARKCMKSYQNEKGQNICVFEDGFDYQMFKRINRLANDKINALKLPNDLGKNDEFWEIKIVDLILFEDCFGGWLTDSCYIKQLLEKLNLEVPEDKTELFIEELRWLLYDSYGDLTIGDIIVFNESK